MPKNVPIASSGARIEQTTALAWPAQHQNKIMSSESTEKRIECLEAQIAALVSLFKSTSDGNHRIHAALLKCVMNSNEQNLKTLRLISLNSSFGDADWRQQLTDMIAMSESNNDVTAALINDLVRPSLEPNGTNP